MIAERDMAFFMSPTAIERLKMPARIAVRFT
jgi:hypothetical protein